MDRISTISKRLRITFAIFMALVPLITILFWYFFRDLPADLVTWKMPSVVAQKYLEEGLDSSGVVINAATLWFGFFADLIPTSVIMIGLYLLYKVFCNYESGIIFSVENARNYRKLAFVVFAKCGADILYNTLSALAFTFQAPQGQRMGIIGFGTSELALVFVGSIILLISWVMEEAKDISEEQALTI